MRTTFSALCLISLMVGPSCLVKKSSDESSKTKDLNPGTRLDGSAGDLSEHLSVKGRRPVVIHYANEPFGTVEKELPSNTGNPGVDNWNALFTKTLAIKSAEGYSQQEKKFVVHSLDPYKEDVVKFGAVVTKDRADLTSLFCVENSEADLVLFSNKWERRDANGRIFQEFHLCKDGKESKRQFEIHVNESHPSYSTHPLSDELTFERAMETVKEIFPPKDHTFALILKSHGSETHVAVPKLYTDVRSIEAKALWDGLISIMKVFENLLDRPEGKVGLGVTVESAIAKAAGDLGIGDGTIRVGISKQGFIDTIERLNRAGDPMYFALMFLESCNSELDIHLSAEEIHRSFVAMVKPREMDPNRYGGRQFADVVTSLFTSDSTGLQYSTVEWKEIKSIHKSHPFDKLEYILSETAAGRWAESSANNVSEGG